MKIALSRVLTSTVVSLCFAQAAGATSITIYPNSPNVATPTTVTGNGSTSAPGFATGSFQANAINPGEKSEIYIPSAQLFANPITIDDIQSISYFTNKPGATGDPDWTFYIYTALQGSGDSGSFYHTRLNSEPYLTNTPAVDAPANTWNEWSTDAPNPMRFYDANRNGGIFGTYTDPTLADLQAGSMTWPGQVTPIDYGPEVINLFSFQTGSAWANGFVGLLDGFTVTLNDGTSSTVNFEAAPGAAAVPEPGSLVLLGSGIIAGARRWRKRRVNA
jgi:hypothetical protein